MLNETLNYKVYAREEHWEKDLLVACFATEAEADKCADALDKFSSIAMIQIRKTLLVERKKTKDNRCSECGGKGTVVVGGDYEPSYHVQCDYCRGHGYV